ncbi:topoisomerase DNA-binding C4 zinc finger domain-containing protein, partial [uncultured Bifidobacterium sp.]|uniref:topoisomerase DNA-binding C4 zinc finger domain-containing protein n=1 Tax=uncultured Bifidobacterium sp. TaxID=165187 RepID=UPI0026205565
GLAAQIDVLVVARKLVYVIECKNLYGDIEITEEGDFVRLLSRGHYRRREGIYSPITQNQRHLELIKALRGSAKGTIARALFERFFDDTYRSVVVLANPRTVLNATAAPRDVRDQVIRADRLKEYITDVEKRAERAAMNDKEMEELARFFKDANDRASETAEAGSRPAEQAEAATSSMLESKVVATVGVTDVKETSQSAGNNDANVHESDETADASDQSAVSGRAQDGASSRPSCPRCGSEMVLRTARRGEKAETRFYGCSRFPHCRGILPVES